jgi:hypothetical protein
MAEPPDLICIKSAPIEPPIGDAFNTEMNCNHHKIDNQLINIFRCGSIFFFNEFE